MKFHTVLLVLFLLPFSLKASELGRVAVYGDSFVYRSGWSCSELNVTPEQCEALRVDSSFASYLEYPTQPRTEPAFDLVRVDGRGGSSCVPVGSDPGMASRLRDDDAARVALLIGINDVNRYNRSVQDTVNCIVSLWRVIADRYGSQPVQVLYPPISRSVWKDLTASVADQRRIALNGALVQAAWQFNQGRTNNPVKIVRLENVYDPNQYTWDGVHPKPEGASRIAVSFYLTIRGFQPDSVDPRLPPPRDD